MKVKVFEEICNEFGGFYEHEITDDNRWMFVSWRICGRILFTDDLSKINRKAKKSGFKLQYIANENDGLTLRFIKG